MGLAAKLADQTFELSNAVAEPCILVDIWIIPDTGVVDLVDTEASQAELDAALTRALTVTLSF